VRHEVADRSPVAHHHRFEFLASAGGVSVSSLARRIALGVAALAVIACDADSPTAPTALATPSEPLLTLTGGAGTLIFPIVTPGEFQPRGVAVGLNNSGQVTGAGRILSTDDQNKAYRWTPGAAAVKLIGCCDTQYGVDINDAGVVVGSEQVSAIIGWRGFVATGTTMVRLSILDGAPVDGDAHAYAINDAGQIVGESVSPDRSRHAVLWSPAGWIHDLGTLGGSRSAAVDINSSSQVIGSSQIAGNAVTHYFLWSPGTGMQDLNATIDPNITSVVEINDAGQIVGTYTAPNGQSHAFRYTPGAGLQDLGTLGGTFSEPTGLNGKGDVVGRSAIADGTVHAFLWTEAEGLEDITAVTGIPEVRRLNDNLQTLTGTAPPTSIVLFPPGLTARLIQLEVTQNDAPPIALFTWSCNGLTCTLDATGSIDDKPGLTYSWDLNKYPDGSATGMVVTVTYPHSNPRTVTLTVTDSKGQTSSSSQTIPVSDYPIAAFTYTCTGLTCSFDSGGSTNGGNPIGNRIWYFGDGQTNAFNVAAPSHSYAQPGTYTVKLEVWGSSLQERGIVTRQITVTTAAQNQPPVADFSWSCTGTVCTLDASTSTDDVGIASYDWSLGKFPDGTATGVSVTTDYWHTSTRTVTLTVTDTNGQTNSVTQTLTIP
jgi:probable HAF family extracellular repeat protein